MPLSARGGGIHQPESVEPSAARKWTLRAAGRPQPAGSAGSRGDGRKMKKESVNGRVSSPIAAAASRVATATQSFLVRRRRAEAWLIPGVRQVGGTEAVRQQFRNGLRLRFAAVAVGGDHLEVAAAELGGLEDRLAAAPAGRDHLLSG